MIKYKGGKKVSKVGIAKPAKKGMKKEGSKYSPIKTKSDNMMEKARRNKLRRKASMSQNKSGSKSQKRKYFNSTYEEGK